MIEAFIDNETWGIRTTSVVRSVGIVLFEGRTVLETQYFRLPQEPQILAGRTMDQSTIDWWDKPENAKANETISLAPMITVEEGRTICGKIGDRVQRIWSKPGMFDLPMLRDLFGQDIWAYWKENCLSTLLAEFDPKRTTRPQFEGTQHDALDDAMHAHVWLCDLRDSIPRMLEESRMTPGGKIWSCKIGEVGPNVVPAGADAPMRNAVTAAYRQLTGVDPNFLFSGWGGWLDQYERKVAESKPTIGGSAGGSASHTDDAFSGTSAVISGTGGGGGGSANPVTSGSAGGSDDTVKQT